MQPDEESHGQGHNSKRVLNHSRCSDDIGQRSPASNPAELRISAPSIVAPVTVAVSLAVRVGRQTIQSHGARMFSALFSPYTTREKRCRSGRSGLHVSLRLGLYPCCSSIRSAVVVSLLTNSVAPLTPPPLLLILLACAGVPQHALLVHEGGFFSDEKGRLGCFSTLEELLKSKIRALARHPLTFRREGNRYDRR